MLQPTFDQRQIGQRYRSRYTFIILIKTYIVFDIDVRPLDILIVAKNDNEIHLLKSFLLFASGDGNVSRKFELDDGESEEADSEVHFKFGRQSEITLACKYSRFSGSPLSPNTPATKDSETAVFAGF